MRDHVVTTQSELGETWHDQLRQNTWGDLKQASVILKGWIFKKHLPGPFIHTISSKYRAKSFAEFAPWRNTLLSSTPCNSAMLQVHVKHAELSGIHLDPESVQENDHDNRHTCSEHQGSICHLPYCGSSAAT